MVGPADDPDVQLMLAFQRGDRASLARLFRRYTQPLVGFAYRMLRDRGRAEEAAQEVFLKVVEAARDYRPTGRFSTWIFTIAARHCLNEVRDRREVPVDPEALAEGGGGDERSPEERLERREAMARLEEALAELPETQRAALLMTAREGVPYRAVGEALGISEKAVKSLVHRARASLRGRLGGTGTPG